MSTALNATGNPQWELEKLDWSPMSAMWSDWSSSPQGVLQTDCSKVDAPHIRRIALLDEINHVKRRMMDPEGRPVSAVTPLETGVHLWDRNESRPYRSISGILHSHVVSAYKSSGNTHTEFGLYSNSRLQQNYLLSRMTFADMLEGEDYWKVATQECDAMYYAVYAREANADIDEMMERIFVVADVAMYLHRKPLYIILCPRYTSIGSVVPIDKFANLCDAVDRSGAGLVLWDSRNYRNLTPPAEHKELLQSYPF